MKADMECLCLAGFARMKVYTCASVYLPVFYSLMFSKNYKPKHGPRAVMWGRVYIADDWIYSEIE